MEAKPKSELEKWVTYTMFAMGRRGGRFVSPEEAVGYAQGLKEGALHLLKVAEEWTNVTCPPGSDAYLHCMAMVDHLKEYCGVEG